MKQVHYLAAALLILAGAGLAQTAYAQTRIAVVDPMRLIREAPQAEKARESLKSEFASRHQQLQSLQDKLVGEQKTFNKNKTIMSAAQRKHQQDQLQQDAQQFQEKQAAYNRDVQQAEQKAFGRLRQKILNVIQSVAKRRHYDLVLSGGIVYASKKVDITDDVLRQLRHDDHAGH